MSKELEALERIREKLARHYNSENIYEWSVIEDDLDIIESALKEKANVENRLDEIFENHNIKSFTELNERLCDYNELKFDDDIKQKKLKALKIIKEKRVNACEIINSKDIREYNWSIHTPKKYPLTQEEYDLLKEVLL